MNYIKAQNKVFKKLVSGDRVCYFKVGEDKIFVTTDGFHGFVFPLSVVSFNVEKLQEFKKIPLDEVVSPENELFLTDDLRMIPAGANRGLYRRLKAVGKNVFANNKFFDCFQNPKFYQPKDQPLQAIVVTEKNYKDGKQVPVGLVLPIRCTWDCEYVKEGETA